MKIITRTVYVAEDGKEFSDEGRCAQYEKDGCALLRPIAHWMDTPIPISDAKAWEWMLNGDGDLCYATEHKVSDQEVSRYGEHPKWATHVIYFGK